MHELHVDLPATELSETLQERPRRALSEGEVRHVRQRYIPPYMKAIEPRIVRFKWSEVCRQRSVLKCRTMEGHTQR